MSGLATVKKRRLEALWSSSKQLSDDYMVEPASLTEVSSLDDMAYEQWGDGSTPYRPVIASLGRLVDFLQGDYQTVVRVPIWCIGLE